MMIEHIAQIVTATTILITAMSAMIVAYYRGIKDVKREKRGLPVKIQHQSNVDVLITKELEKLKELLHADAVHVFDFHNGGYFANGRSSLKLSCTYEVVRAGHRRRQMELQNIPISVLSMYVNTLLNRGKLYTNNIQELSQDMTSIVLIREQYNVKGFYDIVLVNEYNEPIGVLSVIYIYDVHDINSMERKEALYRAKYLIENTLKSVIKGN